MSVAAVRDRVKALKTEQGGLMSDVQAIVARVNNVSRQIGVEESAGLGVLPLIPAALGLIILALLATVAYVGGKVVIHSQKTNQAARELDLIEKGLLTPQEAEALRRAMPPEGGGGFGLGALFGSLPTLAIAGLAAWLLIPRMLRGR